MRIVFAGSPAAAVPSLRAVLQSRHQVLAVLSRPDAPAGRGRRLTPAPVAALAREAAVAVLTPRRPGDPAFLETLAGLAPDCCPVVAYGALIPASALALPGHGWVNLHFSLLPAWRGAAPVQHAILAGDDVTGASTFRLEEGLDTGPVYGVITEALHADDTTGSLLDRLANAGARLLVTTLDGIEDGTLEARPQAGQGISYAPKLEPGHARLDWGKTAAQIDRLVRACTPAPGAWATFREERLGLGPVRIDPAGPPIPPGVVRADRRAVRVGTATGPVVLGEVAPSGRRRMSAADWARGVRPGTDERLR